MPLSILVYHNVGRDDDPLEVEPRVFEAQLSALRDADWHFVDLTSAVACLRRGSLPRRRVCLTFDDAYTDFAEHAWPVLSRLHAPCVLFVPFGYLGRRSAWGGGRAREVLSARALRGFPTWLVTLGSHTQTHPDLRLLNASELARELGESLERAREFTGRTEIALAYPYGRFDRRTRDMAAKAGYSAACTNLSLWGNWPGTDPFSLERIVVRRSDTPESLKRRLAAPTRVAGWTKARQVAGRLMLDATSPARGSDRPRPPTSLHRAQPRWSRP